MYRSTGHWRPLLNGYASYYPLGFRERMELVRKLPDLDSLVTLRRASPLTTIVVRASGMPAMTIGRWRKAIAAGKLPYLHIEYADDEVLVIGFPAYWPPEHAAPVRGFRPDPASRRPSPARPPAPGT